MEKPFPNFPYFPIFAAATSAFLDFYAELTQVAPATSFMNFVSCERFKAGDSEGVLVKFLLANNEEFAKLDMEALNAHEFRGNLFFYCGGFEWEFSDGFWFVTATLLPMD